MRNASFEGDVYGCEGSTVLLFYPRPLPKLRIQTFHFGALRRPNDTALQIDLTARRPASE